MHVSSKVDTCEERVSRGLVVLIDVWKEHLQVIDVAAVVAFRAALPLAAAAASALILPSTFTNHLAAAAMCCLAPLRSEVQSWS